MLEIKIILNTLCEQIIILIIIFLILIILHYTYYFTILFTILTDQFVFYSIQI